MEVRGRGPCPEAQCPGGVRGVPFRCRDPAGRILNRDQTKIFQANRRWRTKRLHGFNTGENSLSGVRVSGHRSQLSVLRPLFYFSDF